MKKSALILGMATVLAAQAAEPQQSVAETNQNVATVAQQDSLKTIINSAQKGDAAAQNEVGSWYYIGKHGLKVNYDEAYKWWSKSALSGNALGIGNLGLCYQLGRGVEKDSVDALRLYDKSIQVGNTRLLEERVKLADAGSVFDCVFVARCYQKGVGTDKNANKAIEYFEKAAKAKSTDAQRELGLCYMNKGDFENAARWFKTAATDKDLTSTYYYGHLLINGKGVSKDAQQGVIYMLGAANSDFAQAQYEMGELYAQGLGVHKDEAQSAAWFKKAACNNSAKGMWALANCYMNATGIAHDYNQAIVWFGKAAAKGYRNALIKMFNDAAFQKSHFYTYLKGLKSYRVDKNLDSAMEQFKALDKLKIAEAKTMVGVCFANKDYAKHNPKKAVKEFTKAAKEDAAANLYLATMYELGQGVEKDFAKALELYLKAAEMENATAQCYVGDLYFEGRGVEQDYKKAVEFYLAAERQHQLTINAAKRLASCYENGLGVDVDKVRAKKLLAEKHADDMTELLNLVK